MGNYTRVDPKYYRRRIEGESRENRGRIEGESKENRGRIDGESRGNRARIEGKSKDFGTLRNALDATKSAANPTIEILLVAGDTVSIQIRDNGEGIDNLDELFEPFYTTKQPGDGVGLGLAISSGIVNDLGGRLTARNAVDGGAIFEVQLPIIRPDVAAAE